MKPRGQSGTSDQLPVFSFTFVVPEGAVDRNGHVNNIDYVRWMQDAAIRHSRALGGIISADATATWVVRSHEVTYLRPAFGGEIIRTETWLSEIRKVRVLRQYRFVREEDGETIAEGRTNWVYVDVATGRPRPIPPELAARFQGHSASAMPDEQSGG